MRIETRNRTLIHPIDAIMGLVELRTIQSVITPFKSDRSGERNCVRYKQTLICSFEVISDHLQLIGVEVDNMARTKLTPRTICNRPGIERKRPIKSASSHDTRSWCTGRRGARAQLSSGNPGIHHDRCRAKCSVQTPCNKRQRTPGARLQVHRSSALDQGRILGSVKTREHGLDAIQDQAWLVVFRAFNCTVVPVERKDCGSRKCEAHHQAGLVCRSHVVCDHLERTRIECHEGGIVRGSIQNTVPVGDSVRPHKARESRVARSGCLSAMIDRHCEHRNFDVARAK